MAWMAPYLGQQHGGLLWLCAAVGLLTCEGAVLHNCAGAVSRQAGATCRSKDDVSKGQQPELFMTSTEQVLGLRAVQWQTQVLS